MRRSTKHGRAPSPEVRERAFDALALARRTGISLSQAARTTGTTRRTVLRHAGAGFQRDGRRWAPRPFDRMVREMTVLTPEGPITVAIRDSRTASLVAEHANAVRAYLRTGDEHRLDGLRRGAFQLGGETIRLVTDADVIDRLAAGAETHYEVYRR
ncbi:MAG: hypothetical protein NVS9B8_18210 [Candidatus Limnocylindrales bacterium]